MKSCEIWQVRLYFEGEAVSVLAAGFIVALEPQEHWLNNYCDPNGVTEKGGTVDAILSVKLFNRIVLHCKRLVNFASPVVI